MSTGGDGSGSGPSKTDVGSASSSGAPGSSKDDAEKGSGTNAPQKRKWFDRDGAINAQRRGLRSSLSTLQTQLTSVKSDLRTSLDSVARLPSAQQKLYLGEVPLGLGGRSVKLVERAKDMLQDASCWRFF